MSLKNLTVVLFLVLAAAGCAGRRTSDPAVMLTWASEDFSSKDNPVAAEELLQQALQIYRKQMNRQGLAETYRQYGLFFRSTAVAKREEHYNTIGFLDETARFRTRYEKAIEYLGKSRDLFLELQQYAALSEVHLSMAKTYAVMGKQSNACDSVAKGRESYAMFRKHAPEAKDVRPDEIERQESYLALLRTQLECDKQIPVPAAAPPAVTTSPSGTPVSEPTATSAN